MIAITAAASPAIGQPPALETSEMPTADASPGPPRTSDEGVLWFDRGAASQRRAPATASHADVSRILGKEVRSASGEAMGRIVDVLVDETGRPRAAVVDFGGFLGVGTRKIATG